MYKCTCMYVNVYVNVQNVCTKRTAWYTWYRYFKNVKCTICTHRLQLICVSLLVSVHIAQFNFPTTCNMCNHFYFLAIDHVDILSVRSIPTWVLTWLVCDSFTPVPWKYLPGEQAEYTGNWVMHVLKKCMKSVRSTYISTYYPCYMDIPGTWLYVTLSDLALQW